MKKRISLILIALFLMLFSPKVYAGSLNVWSSSSSVVEGGSVTVTVKANGLAGKFSITSSNGNVLSGGTSSVWIENGSVSYKFQAKSTGSATITVNPIDVGDLSTNGKYTGSKSVTIKVVKPREKSNNNDLSSLSVEGFSLTPDFSKNQLEYSVEVPAETEKVKINASKADGYSSMDGVGEKEVSEGDNRFEIKVTSETGREKIYVVHVNVKDNNPIEVKINDKQYTVVKKASSLTKPELFEEKKSTIGDVEVPSFYNESSNLTLVGLRDEDGKISLYIYDSKNNSYTKYQPLTSSSISIISLPNQEDFKKYSKISVKIDNETYEGYQINSKSNYIYLYGQRLDNGKKSWYVYDKEEKTIQLYQDEEAKKVQEEYEEKLEESKFVIFCLGGISITLLLIILILVLTRKSGKKKVKSGKKNSERIKEEIHNQSTEVSSKVSEEKLELEEAKKIEDTLSEIEGLLNEGKLEVKEEDTSSLDNTRETAKKSTKNKKTTTSTNEKKKKK